jgi:tRNA(fMet)-specific endonuclease VapC
MLPLALLDTDTLSEIMKGQNPSVEHHAREYLRTHGQFRFSIIKRYEILRGLKSKQALKQISIFENKCKSSYIYPITDEDEIVGQASDIYAYLYQKGLLINDADILIAATAIVHDLTLITGNNDHFNRIPNLLYNSWNLPPISP